MPISNLSMKIMYILVILFYKNEFDNKIYDADYYYNKKLNYKIFPKIYKKLNWYTFTVYILL